jgi:hypothetical protein
VIFEELFSPLLAQDFELHRKQILFAFDHLDDFASREGQHFIFVHFVAPHPPFVFDANGEDISPPWIYSLEETPYRKDKEMYLEQYTNELIYINSLVQQAVTNILAKSDVQPIIIIQGDHGPGAFLNWDSVEDSNLKERQAILNAYLLPEYMKDSLYDSISPVNSFRLILSQLFGFDIELLPDKIYFSSWDRPYEFFEITKMLLLD